MKTFTRTFPPGSNPNYGGILQAWALQRVLEDLGHTSSVDSTRSSQPAVLKRIVVSAVRVGMERVLPSSLVPNRSVQGTVKRAANRELLSFAPRKMNTKALYRAPGRVKQRVLKGVDAVLVGSDQVWRASYVDVPSYLLDFLPDSSSVKRIAYAASFGVDDPAQFDDYLVARTKSLAQKFDAISVREESAVELCDQLWGVKAERVIDPTMLLERAAYQDLYGGAEVDNSGATVVSYVLDDAVEKRRAISEIASALSATEVSLFPRTATSVKKFRSDPNEYMRPTVEKWLGNLSSASAVVTDSYHGMLLSILFNRPFLVAVNQKRGATRFDTILDMFGLHDRKLMSDGQDLDRIKAPIDWSAVNVKLADERRRGIDFLIRSLG